jgi:hypothetical protein
MEQKQSLKAVDQKAVVNRFRDSGWGERNFGLSGDRAVNSQTATTLENNGNFVPVSGVETRFCQEVGGGTGTGVEYSLGRNLLNLAN